MSALESLTSQELISNICNICDMKHATSIVNKVDDAYITDEELIAIRDAIIVYRDELISRISNSEYLIDRANLLQLYYRLLACLRSVSNYLELVNTDKDIADSSAKLASDIYSSYASISIDTLEK
jgi:hypothetical protein